MDTKWKKSRAAAGFLALILGVTLLLGSGARWFDRFGVSLAWISDATEQDYQNTRDFQQQMERYLVTFLAMGSGGPLNRYSYSSDVGTSADGPPVVAQEGVGIWYGATPAATVVGGSAPYDPPTAVECKKQAEQFHKEHQEDKNLLYSVLCKGKLLYSNYEGLAAEIGAKTLPEGYNFILTFDGEKVAIVKDGAPLDIYGDGVLRDNTESWRVPGYTNYPTDKSFAEVTVLLAASKDPVGYSSGDGSQQLGNELYWVAQYLDGIRTDAIGIVIAGGVGLALFLVAILLRKDVKGALCALTHSCSTRNLKLPVQKRLLRRNTALLILALLLAGLAGLGLLRILNFTFYDGWHGILSVFVPAAGLVLLLFAPMVWMLWRNRKLIPDLGTLTDQISAVHSGDYSAPSYLPEDSDLRAASEQLSDIEGGMEKAIAERTKSERMKVELITNVSHDIKTPLTAIISYIELLKRQENLSPEVLDYVRILDEKSQKLKTMVLDVFEVSKAAAGQLPVTLEELEFGKLLRQTLADMGEQIEKSGLTLKAELPEDAIRICADGDRLYRVFQNLLQNALTYSLTGSRVFVTLTQKNKIATAVIKNTSKSELAPGIDFTQRFVRGDGSRTDGGSGLGLSIAKSFTEACGGSFEVEVDADLFTATVRFPVV